MNDPRLDYENEFPIEITAPDISAYKKTNTDIDYIISFDSGFSGPHVFISAVVHGNEPCGAHAIDWFLKNNYRPKTGKISLGFMNIEAYLAFDPLNPNRTRWVDEDFNRLWGKGVLEDRNRNKTYEFVRANEVKHIISKVDFLLDIHSMQKPCIPLMMAGMLDKGIRFAKDLNFQIKVISDSGHIEGMRMRDYNGFSDPKSKKNALLVECGQHWERSSEKVAVQTLVKFLRCVGIMDKNFGAEIINEKIMQDEIDVFKVGEIITIQTENFKFKNDWQGFDKLEKGAVIGLDGDKTIYAPFEETILIMPTKRLFKGKTAVRLAYKI